MADIPGLNPAAAPSGTGCVECEAVSGWWFHLRRCAECGHIGCCDSSPAQEHVHIQAARAQDQPVPGPAGRVPSDWRRHLH